MHPKDAKGISEFPVRTPWNDRHALIWCARFRAGLWSVFFGLGGRPRVTQLTTVFEVLGYARFSVIAHCRLPGMLTQPTLL